MEGWHTTGTALFPLLKRVAPLSGTVTAKVANLQYPSRWQVHLDLKAYKLQEELPHLRALDVSNTASAQYFGRRAYQHDRVRVQRLLQRLKEIDPTIWRYLRPKHEVEDRFRMRLLKDDDYGSRQDLNGLYSSNDASSYIALSYCWHYSTWTPNPDLIRSSVTSTCTKPSLPITAPMWQAFLAERRNPAEALWVDQGCIHQADDNAKMDAVNSMDIVFGGARKVVIALEDVLLTPQDAEALLQYYHAIQSISGRQRLLVWTDWLQFLDHKEELAVACLKIFRARWFRRAWCSHEFLTARSHVFLVPVLTSPHVKPRDSATVLNFNADFLLALLLARTDWIVSQERSELAKAIVRHDTALTDSNTNPTRAMNSFLMQNIIMVGFTQGLIEALLKHESSESRKPYLGTLGDVLSLESSSAVDKLAITLNVLKTGLSYQGPSSLSETDVSLIATLIAFAADDASALASSGSFLQAKELNIVNYDSTEPDRSCHSGNVSPQPRPASGETRNPIGWATLPQVDTYTRLGSERVETPVHATMARGGLQLALSFVACSKSIRAPDEKFLAFTRTLLSWYQGQVGHRRSSDHHVSDEDAVLAEFRAFSLESDQVHQALTGIDRPELIRALACLLELGAWWPAAYGRHVKPSFLSHATDEVNEPDRTLQKALSWVQSLISLPVASNLQLADIFGPDEACEQHISRLLRYASDVVRTGAGERSEFVKKQNNPDFAFQLCMIRDVTSGTTSGVDVPIFAPANLGSLYELAIPLALTTHDFPVDMNRVWVLERRAAEDISAGGSQCREYRLRGKTRFVGCTVPDGRVRRVTVSG
ncbi:MAG: hypothetical protein HETSPECPRED_000607 [Heterodermia speciosa]|uniref:Heterokaryon incompatibility domain-containing protein n=1 Tax=Heterodermia speciosa TaxID=116794 RepID=A0A8H3IZU7_9LECA|nr:MAG: hypothetical protein HETSPECPRED_000607 [Heterodermia speciosa]